MIRDTWWAWIVLLAFGLIGGFTLSRIFFSAIPISIGAFFYFAIMRYDENGNPTSID